MRLPSKILSIAAAPLAAGCEGVQSALDPQGPAAVAIAQSAWIMGFGAAAILALVMALALYAVYRAPGRRAPSSTAVIVAGGVALPVVALSALLAYGVTLTRELRERGGEAALELEVIGHRWWWEVRYPGAAAGETVASANEIRIPAGRPVAIALSSADVIHSFWVPSLAGKIDAIPGRVNRIVLRAAQPGSFRGQCAEFCGAQHARMVLEVRAETPEDFERWLADLRQPARAAAAPGAGLFKTHCAQCHTVRGVAQSAGRLAAPDLTHVASRPRLGGTLENTPQNMAVWIERNDALKPGNAMPAFRELEPRSLEALAAWLSSLE